MSTSTPITQYVLVRRTGLSPDAFAERTGLHPDLARKLVALGLLDAHRYAGGEMSFDPSEVTHAARIQRLRTGLGLNYSAIGLVLDLLDRIERLENSGPQKEDILMDTGSLTEKSREALQEAQNVATRMGHTEVDGEHLLLALVDQQDGLVPRLLEQAGANVEALRSDLDRELSRRPKVSGPGATPGQVMITQRLAKLLDAAEREAKRTQGFLRVGGASCDGPLRGRIGQRGRAGPRQSRGHTGRLPHSADEGGAAISVSRRQPRRGRTRHWRSTGATSSPRDGQANSIRSSAGMPRYAG